MAGEIKTMSRRRGWRERTLSYPKEHIFGLLVAFFIIVLVFGFTLYIDPYLITGYQTIEGMDVWAKGPEAEALILFNLTSKGFISANYPVEVTANIQVINNTLLSFLTEKTYVEMDITGTYAYPIRHGSLGI